ncbi:hypothetical protein OTB20_36715 [Streptomyces sp. H27-H1]|uniref:hypothetical protein n=1 Tax=Streptomyces sp. H27-H1 TaxID=2996461 RepID=UPI00226E6DE3|nr:hypothetical protein [Streptomyces sp. H27-H1]MCY0931629.1 hypothetical protein [Streptomyces sp. H27-H1]
MSTFALQYASAESEEKAAAVVPERPEIQNGGFEKPRVTGASLKLPEGWQGDAQQIMLYGFGDTPEGTQFAAFASSRGISQEFDTVPGTILRYSVDHRKAAYSGLSALHTIFSDASDPSGEKGRSPGVAQSDTDWKTFAGEYLVPAGQTKTRLEISSDAYVNVDNLKVEYAPVVTGEVEPVAPVQVGEDRALTANIYDGGGVPVKGAIFSVALPEGIAYVDGTAKVSRMVDGKPQLIALADGQVNVTNGVLAIPVGAGAAPGKGGELVAEDHYKVTYDVRITDRDQVAVMGGEFAHKPVLKHAGRGEGYASATVPFPEVKFGIASADMGLEEGSGFSKEEYVKGEMADLSLTVKNNGPQEARGVLLKIDKPSTVDWSTFKPVESEGLTCERNDKAQRLECTVNPWESGKSQDFRFTGEIDSAGPLFSRVDLSSLSIDRNGANNFNTYQSKATKNIDLGVRADVLRADGKTSVGDGERVNPGESVLLSVKLDNAGPARPGEVEVYVPLPQGVVLDESKVDGEYSSADGVWTIDGVDVGESATLTLPVTVPAEEEAVNLEASIVSYGDLQETAAGNNKSTKQVHVNRNSKLKVGVSVDGAAPDAGPYTPGDRVKYSIAVTNDGPSTAREVQISHVMPAGMEQLRWGGPAGTYYTDGVWTVPSVGVGEEKTAVLTVEGLVPADQDGSGHRVCVTGASKETPDLRGFAGCDDGNTIEGHMAVHELNVAQRAAAYVEVSADRGKANPPLPGQPVTWTVKAANAGPSAAKGLEIEAPVPAGVSEPAAVDEQGGTFEDGMWKPADIPSGGEAVLKLTGTVLPDHDNLDYTVTVKQSRTPLDENQGNKIGQPVKHSIKVQQVAGLDVAITVPEGSEEVKVGEEAKVRVTVSNKEGPSTARGTVVELGLPAVKGLLHDGGKNFNGERGTPGFGSWNAGDLKAGEERTLTLTFTPDKAKEFPFNALAVHSQAANPQECQDICASAVVKATASTPGTPDSPDDGADPSNDGGGSGGGSTGSSGGDGGNGDGGDSAGGDSEQSVLDQALAATGSNALWWGLGGLGAAGIGAALLIAARRRH